MGKGQILVYIKKGEIINKTTQNHRIHKIENKYTKQGNNHKKYIKNHKSNHLKITNRNK